MATPQMHESGSSSTALAFVDRINARDVPGLAALMTSDHTLVDATGARQVGRMEMQRAWEEYFSAFPEYGIEIVHHEGLGAVVLMIGYASGRSKTGIQWRIPTAWYARTQGNLVAEWRVYADVEPMLRSLGIDRFGNGGLKE